MANQHRSSSNSLKRLSTLQREPEKFNFLSAIRILDGIFLDQPPTGTSNHPSTESVRIGQEATLNFSPRSIASFKTRTVDGRYRLLTFFLGIFGPNGPMPVHLTDFAQQRIRHHQDETLSNFVDVFHHSMACFFYRAWAASQPTVHMDRPETDRFTMYVASLCGLGQSSLRQRDAMPDNAKLYFAAHLAASPKHSSGLTSILRSFFKANVEVIPFVSHWIKLPEDCYCKLGTTPDSGMLGINLTLGSRVKDCQQRFRVVLGPLGFEKFCQLLPYGSSMKRLRSIIDQYIGLELSWDVQLVLAREEVPRFTLGRQGQLGWTTWLASQRLQKDADQLVVDPYDESRNRLRPSRHDINIAPRETSTTGA